MSDYISREQADQKLEIAFLGLDREHYNIAKDLFNHIPSANVRENIHGEWIQNFLGIDICSECGEPMRDRRVNHINFCNCCGADMRGET